MPHFQGQAAAPPGSFLRAHPSWGPSPWCLWIPLTPATEDHMTQTGRRAGSSPPTAQQTQQIQHVHVPPGSSTWLLFPPPAITPTPERVSHLLISTCNSWASSRAPQTQQSKQTPFPKSTPYPWLARHPLSRVAGGQGGGQHKWGLPERLPRPRSGHVEIHTDAFSTAEEGTLLNAFYEPVPPWYQNQTNISQE